MLTIEERPEEGLSLPPLVSAARLSLCRYFPQRSEYLDS
jgi:hypothetical protein